MTDTPETGDNPGTPAGSPRGSDRVAFLEQCRQAFPQGFRRLVLSLPLSLPEDRSDLVRLEFRPVILKGRTMIALRWQFRRRDEQKNLDTPEALTLLDQALGTWFRNADLDTPSGTASLRISKKGAARMILAGPPAQSASSGRDREPALMALELGHDRPRHRRLDPKAPWLALLGICDAEGKVIPRMQDKYRQIDKFLEILDTLLPPPETGASPGTGKELRVLDMGSGKAYLTFAIHAHLRNGWSPRVTGVEWRQALVDHCNRSAREAGFAPALDFRQGSIADIAPLLETEAGSAAPGNAPPQRGQPGDAARGASEEAPGACHSAREDAFRVQQRSDAPPQRGQPGDAARGASEEAPGACHSAREDAFRVQQRSDAPPAGPVVVALHACDTATDDAIAAAIHAGARVLVCSPCCQKQVRRDMHCPAPLSDMTRHGILEERLAEMVTDSVRALVLEAWGYRVKVFEFISLEHTGKNVMITGVRPDGGGAVPACPPRPEFLDRARELMASCGVRHHYLLDLQD